MIRQQDSGQYVKNVLAAWYAAAEDARALAAGRAWYRVGQRAALDICPGDLARGAGIIAALSPQTVWSENLRRARVLVQTGTVGAFTRDVRKAQRILAGESWQTVLPAGSKTWNFAANLTGDTSAVTVDRWAVRVALAGLDVPAGTGAFPNGAKITAAQYRVIAGAYSAAAAIIGEAPSVVQAVTWVAARCAAD